MSTKWFKRRSSYRNQLLKIPVMDSDNGPLPYIEPVIRPKLECITGIESVPCRVRAANYSSILSTGTLKRNATTHLAITKDQEPTVRLT